MRLHPLVHSLAVLLVATGLAGCQDANSWHQKLTVTVATPDGERSGEAVIKVVSRFGQIPGSASEVSYDVSGEATVIEIAPGKYLFALLGSSEERFYRAVRNQPAFKGKRRGEWLAIIPKTRGAVTLAADNYPLLVTFADIDDPKTVRRVDPDNLAANFGPGVALKSISLEITGEKVTQGRVEQVLGWILEAGKNRFNVSKTPDGNIPLNAFLSVDHWR
jgi:hypothetical protein